MKRFLLRRLLGLAYVFDGLAVCFGDRNPMLALTVARMLACERLTKEA